MTAKSIKELNFHSPATYRVVIKGRLSSDWLDQFSDLDLQITKSEDGEYQSVLQGTLLDQTQLSGILSSIYSMHLPILEIKWVDNN